MKKIIFLCHGNICRSPAAEYIFKDLLKKEGKLDLFSVSSRAVSSEEIGNDIYPPMKRALSKAQIGYGKHEARRITQEEYDEADYIFYMDESNYRRLVYRINDHKRIALPLFQFTKGIYEIEDPWYTDAFDKVVEEITICLKDILKNIC